MPKRRKNDGLSGHLCKPRFFTKLAFRFFERSYFDGEGFRSNDTTSTVLGHVSKMTAYKTKDGWTRKYALTSKMKTIFKNLDYDEKKIDGFLKDELSKSV